jgi:hypothetical protein
MHDERRTAYATLGFDLPRRTDEPHHRARSRPRRAERRAQRNPSDQSESLPCGGGDRDGARRELPRGCHKAAASTRRPRWPR